MEDNYYEVSGEVEFDFYTEIGIVEYVLELKVGFRKGDIEDIFILNGYRVVDEDYVQLDSEEMRLWEKTIQTLEHEVYQEALRNF